MACSQVACLPGDAHTWVLLMVCFVCAGPGEVGAAAENRAGSRAGAPMETAAGAAPAASAAAAARHSRAARSR